MKRNIFLFLFFVLSVVCVKAQYSMDVLGGRFEMQTLNMPDDYDGKVITTVIRREARVPTHKALLYVHGYNDYFFQSQLAQIFNDSCYNFYAVDLRKYGRSLMASQTAFQVHNLNEYFADIDTTLSIMKSEGNTEIILMGHSTGGLITALYCNERRNSLSVKGLILNSPFLDMNQSWMKEKILIPVVSFLGLFSPNIKIKQSKSTAYAESLLIDHHGEWIYDTSKKFKQSPPVTSGWIRAIHRGQKKVHRGLDIPCPVLVMFSSQSVYGDDWTPEHQKGDAVLDVKDIEKYGKRLGPHVTEAVIPEGLHDLILSQKSAREKTYETIFEWLDSNKL